MNVEKPYRVTRTYTQRLIAPADDVFPLLCPVRELEWVKGWQPGFVISASGLAEEDAVFSTREEGREALWIITRHNPQLRFVEFCKVTPGFTVAIIRIQLEITGKRSCDAHISYSYTALSNKGRAFINAFSAEKYAAFMQEWETDLNDYLKRNR